jgi:zinc finger protein
MYVDASEDLMARVIRSSTCTVEVPELGIRIDPGPACEASITNVEGILQRMRETVESVQTWVENAERECANTLLETISRAIDGSFQFTLIIEDPSGNSAIISKKAKKTTCIG